ncbi:proboscipedia [Carabus blaptoides fortunei]
MRIKHPVRMPTGGHLDGDDFVSVKTRPPTPDGAAGHGGAGAGFWLSAVTASSAGAIPMDGCNETGFINSQPSMAEFMTALPHLSGDIPHGGPPLSPQQTPPGAGYPMDTHGPPHGLGSPGVNVPEYPWMKEKKTTRKSNQQGR